MDDSRLFLLFERYYRGLATPVEKDELLAHLKSLPDETVSGLLEKTWNTEDPEQVFFTPDTREKFLHRLPPAATPEAFVKPLEGKRRRLVIRIAAAAVLFFAISLAVVFLLKQDAAKENGMAKKPAGVSKERQIVPGGDKAVLTLSDGSQIVLDSASNGDLAQQGGSTIIKIGGRLNYAANGQSSQVLYNTITTPRGGQYQVELADGSKVWLNAASSLRFPTAFAENVRTVELSGEGYFEVAHDPAKPFYVKVNDLEVQVVGTHFNINGYANEPAVKTTLLEGRVRVKNSRKHVFLNPGQQAVVSAAQDDLRIIDDVDVEEVVAWKNGRFLFNSTDLEAIMRQAARWYDADVQYEGKTAETFSGSLPRTENITQLLKIMEATEKVSFRIQGKEIMVKPK